VSVANSLPPQYEMAGLGSVFVTPKRTPQGVMLAAFYYENVCPVIVRIHTKFCFCSLYVVLFICQHNCPSESL